MKEKVKFWGEINFCFALLFSFPFHHIFAVEGGQANENQQNISTKMKNFLHKPAHFHGERMHDMTEPHVQMKE